MITACILNISMPYFCPFTHLGRRSCNKHNTTENSTQSPKQKNITRSRLSLFFTILSPSNLSPSQSPITESPYPSTVTVDLSPSPIIILQSPSPITVTVELHIVKFQSHSHIHPLRLSFFVELIVLH